MCARTVNGFDQLSYWCSGTLIFLECSSMLNATLVKNTFLIYTWLSNCFFQMFFFFYILNTFLGYRLFDNVSMKTYSLCGDRRDKKAFKERKICAVKTSKWILFIYRFFSPSQKMNWESCLPFPFCITNHKKKKKKLKTF